VPVDPRHQLLRALADGEWHSGPALGAELGCSRAAVWKRTVGLRQMGLAVQAGPGRGYRLVHPLELLSEGAITAGLDVATRESLARLEVLFSTPSTSDRLGAMPMPPPGRFHACVAEFQTSGRGRRSRRWLSPVAHGICLSISWSYAITPRDLAALSLVAGLAVVEALREAGVGGVSLKWPNDVVGNGGKLAGLLVDVAGENGGPLRVVIGVGLNHRASRQLAEGLLGDSGLLPPVSLEELVGRERLPPRNLLVATLLREFRRLLLAFDGAGFQPFTDRWRELDYLAGRPLVIDGAGGRYVGTGRGIAADGALLVDDGRETRAIVAGDVTLRNSP
jgi:BirA family biotin operon repressor/biotin-[acetyl-CoA-carboxylase] ligase